MRTVLISLIAAAALSACTVGSAPNYQEQTLPSGKTVKVLSVMQMHFSGGDTALMLKYQTDLSLDDKAALQKEVDDIWSSFRVDVEKAGLSSAIVNANETPKGSLVQRSRSQNFVYSKDSSGQWVQK